MLEIENKINPQGLSVHSSTEGVGGSTSSMSVDAIGARSIVVVAPRRLLYRCYVDMVNSNDFLVL